MKTDCPFSKEISPWLDGELSAEKAEQVRRHMAACSACGNRLEDFTRLDRQLAAMAPIARSADFEAAFWQKFDAIGKKRFHRHWQDRVFRNWLPGWRPALAAAAGVLIISGALLFTQPPPPPALSAEDVVISRNLELFADYDIVRQLDLLEHWTEFSEDGAATDV